MDMGGMGDSAGSQPSCKISMLWNWYTIDSCFLSSTWHNRTKAMFAGSVIGVFFLCMAIEGVRRLGREYDRSIVRSKRMIPTSPTSTSNQTLTKGDEPAQTCLVATTRPGLPGWIPQLLRGFIYGSQFTAAFLVMLLGMYYNGYILFAIFLGQTAGYIAFGRDTLGENVGLGSCC